MSDPETRAMLKRIEEKIELVHLMNDLGIDVADVGLPGAGARAFEDVTTLVRDAVGYDPARLNIRQPLFRGQARRLGKRHRHFHCLSSIALLRATLRTSSVWQVECGLPVWGPRFSVDACHDDDPPSVQR